MTGQRRITQLENRIQELERHLAAKEKICRVLTRRVERSVDSVGGSYSIFERNILLQNLIDQGSKELEKANKKLLEEIDERIQSEQRLHSVIQGSPIPTFVIGKNHRVLYWNKALEELTGIRAEEVIGTTDHWKSFYGEKRPCMADLLVDDSIENIPKWYGEKFVKSKFIEGAYEATDFFPGLSEGGKWLRFTTAAMKNPLDDLIGAIETLEDITDRMRVEQALRASEAELRALFASMTDMVLVIDSKGHFLKIAPTNPKLSYKPPEELLGKKIQEIFPKPKSDLFLNAVSCALEVGRPVELEYNLPIGNQEIWFAATISPISEDTIMWIARDITEKKKVDEERERLRTQLIRARKLEAVGTLAGGVAHDLNNILSGIVSYPDLLLMQIPEHSPLKQPLQTIRDSGHKAAAIVEDLLTLARRSVAIFDVVNLNDIVNDYLNSPEYENLKAFSPNIRLDTCVEAGLLNIMGSKVHLSKTIMNLVSNAAEAMPKGGTIRIAIENRYIDKPVKGYDDVEEGDYVVLSVADSGVGISEVDRERIFEPFFTKKILGRSGTGLGMSVVWGTVKDHRGYIDVQSSEGKGATFFLYFPVTRKKPTQQESHKSLIQLQGRGESILIIDDVESQREIASTLLSQLGYSVAAVGSGENAIEYVKNRSVDLLVLDMIMEPGIDGLDTYKGVLEINPTQKAIIASGFSETDRVKETQKLGAGPYIKKPYSLENLGIAVRNELDRKMPESHVVRGEKNLEKS